MLNVKEEKSIGGLRTNAVAFLVTFSYFIGLGLIFSLIALVLDPDNAFVRKYSKQTLSLSILSIAAIFLNLIFIIGSIVYVIVIIAATIFQIVATISAVSGKEFEIPFINKITDFLFVDHN